MKADRFGVAIVGCGNISEHYANTMVTFPQLEFIGCTDIDLSRAETLATRFKGKVFDSLDALLADSDVDIVLNLTIFNAHYAVSKKCLEAGKHVFGEKPLAMNKEEAFELVELAKKHGVRLACAPSVHMGDAQETAWRFLKTGELGTPRLVFAEVNQGRIESWHPGPEPFYEVGPVVDIGIYAITLTTAMFGPIRQVQGFSQTLMPERQTKEGRKFTIQAPDFFNIIFELDSGVVFRLNCNFYVDTGERQVGYEVHGDCGSLYLSSWHNYDGTVCFRKYGDKTGYREVPLIRQPFTGPKKVEWCRGVNDFANAIRNNSTAMVQGEHAAHVIEAILAAQESARTQRPVKIESTFTPPVFKD